MAIKLSDHIIIKRGSRPNPLSKYEVYNLNSNNNAIPYPIQSDINKNSLIGTSLSGRFFFDKKVIDIYTKQR